MRPAWDCLLCASWGCSLVITEARIGHRELELLSQPPPLGDERGECEGGWAVDLVGPTLHFSGLTPTARWLLDNCSRWCFSGSLPGASGRSLGCAPGVPPGTFPGGV